MERTRYLDFDLRIERSGDHYLARVRSPAGEASGPFTLPISDQDLRILVLQMRGMRSTTRRIRSPEMEAINDFGRKLFDAVFSDDVHAAFMRSLDEVDRHEETGLRLRLILQDTPELANLPWEFLVDRSRGLSLAKSRYTPIVRYIEMAQRIRPLAAALPLQVLVMISSPRDARYASLDVARETSLLDQALAPLVKAGKVRVEYLEDATLTNLRRALVGGRYHIFHFVGHGGFDEKAEEGVLVLEDDEQRGWEVSADRIVTHLQDHRSLRLVVLNACEGARNSRDDPFAGVATTLIRKGNVPAVVAMQFEISDEAAIAFAGEFYDGIARGFPIDAVMGQARKAIYDLPNDMEWGTPVLYMRSPDGVLFELTDAAGADVSVAPASAPPAATVPASPTAKPPGPPAKQPPAPPAAQPPAAPVAQPTAPPAAKAPEPARGAPGPQPVASGPSGPASPSSAKAVTRRPRILEGHTKEVHGVAFDVKDGSVLASASGGTLTTGDRPLRLWSVAEGEVLIALEGHTQGVLCVAFSPNSRLLVSGAHDNTLRIWDLDTGKQTLNLTGHGNSVSAVTFSPDGSTVATGSWDNTVRLWHSADRTSRSLQGHRGFVRGVAFTPDGGTLVSASNDSTLRVWSVADHKIMDILEEHKRAVTCVAVSPDGLTLASGSDDETILLWDLRTREVAGRLVGHTDSVRSLAFSPDGSILASGAGDDLLGDDFSIRLWRMPGGDLLTTLQGHRHVVHSVAFSPNGEHLASGSWDKTIRIWDIGGLGSRAGD